MNEKYIVVAAYHTVISYQFGVLSDVLEQLSEYNPIMREVAACLKELDSDIEEEGRQLLKSIEGGNVKC